MKKFRLIDSNGYATHEFRATDCDRVLEGKLYEVCGWEDDISMPTDYELVMDIVVKWDLCTHGGFSKEYNHICGGFGYLELLRGIAFVVELAKINLKGFSEYHSDYESVSQFNILEGCKIVEID